MSETAKGPEYPQIAEKFLPGSRFRKLLAVGIGLPFGVGLLLAAILLWQISHNVDQATLVWTLLVGALGLGGLSALGTTVLLHSLADQYERALKAYDQLASSMERRVEDRTADLERANRELEAFSYSVSHDLRAPLRSVSSFSMILQEDLEGKLDADSADNLSRIRGAAQKMTDLIDALLRFSRIARAKLELSEVDLSSMAENIVSELERHYHSRNVEYHVQPGLVDTADPHLIRVVLENLLENAWKFTSKSTGAKVEFGRDASGYFVKDNGVGFETEYMDKIFMPFERLHNERDFPGTGIGLASAKRIIERHGGDIWATSELGKGTTIGFTIHEGMPGTMPALESLTSNIA